MQGMLAKDELDARVGHVLASRTYADLAAVTADIPAGVAAIRPPRTSARGRTRKPVSKVKVVAWGASVISVLAALVAVAALLANNNQDSDVTLFFASAWTFIGASTIAWAAMAEARAQKRSRGRLPQGPASSAGGQASRRRASAGPGRQLRQPIPVTGTRAKLHRSVAPARHAAGTSSGASTQPAEPVTGPAALRFWWICAHGGRRR